jgi:tRNA pseudouridine38/39 synthase
MVAVLFLVGERKEAVEVVQQLLDIDAMPRRPNYDMASDAPLLLYSVHYGGGVDDWSPDESAAAGLAELWAEQQRALMLRSAMLHTMRSLLPAAAADEAADAAVRKSAERHVPLAQRPTAESVFQRTKGRAQ